MPDSENILIFDSVSIADDQWYDDGVDRMNLSLNKGDLALLRFNRHSPRNAVPDAAIGLAELTEGTVRVFGKPWHSLSAREAAQRRGAIGRLFGHYGWVNHLDVDENITLRQRHHTKRTLIEIDREACGIAEIFGLREGLPRVRPSNVDPTDLQRSACVRMLLGSPQLIVVDEPASGLYAEVLTPLAEQIAEVRRRGAAVLWLSADPFVWADPSHNPTTRIDLTEARPERHVE